ncbi:MAG: IS630 family transposase [Planctomycetota bacterium]
MVERRKNFSIARRFVPPGSLVFLDESGAQSNRTRRYGRAPVGQRCVGHTAHGHWKTTTLLNAVRLDGVIQDATVIVDGPMNSEVFTAYTERCLAPSLRPGDVVVMGNLSSHESKAVIEAVQAVDGEVWFLPPYSPGLNPIEKLWSKVKAWLRKTRPSNFDTIGRALAEVLRTVTAHECSNYFRSCGYGDSKCKTL